MAERRSGGGTTKKSQRGSRSAQQGSSSTRRGTGSGKQSTGSTRGSSGSTQQAKGRARAQQSSSGQSSRTTRSAASTKTAAARDGTKAASGNNNNLSASDVVSKARKATSELIGRPVEGVLGIERDHDNWVAMVQVVELARIPNTTDVLGDYEVVLDGKGEIVQYHRRRRYHRSQVDGGQQ